jgi:Ca2+/Na+ antiporter
MGRLQVAAVAPARVRQRAATGRGGIRPTPAAWVVLLAAFAASLWYLVRASRRHDFLGGEATEIREEAGKLVEDTRRSWWRPVGLTVFGLGVITVGAELVNYGADSIVRRFAFPAALMSMVVTPAAIAVAAPVQVPLRVITLDWPFLIAVTWLATIFLWRGRVTRWQAAVLLTAYAGYVTTHVRTAS